LDGGTLDQTIVSIKNGTTGLGAVRAQLLVTNSGTSPRVEILGSKLDGNTATGVLSNTVLTVGQTYFVAGVLDFANSSIAIYVNGVQDNNGGVLNWGGNSADTANKFAEIGAYAPPLLAPGSREYWPGVIDGVRIFDQALSAEQIMNLYLHPDQVPVVPEPTAFVLACMALGSLVTHRTGRRR
jgi:hypothetical protein